MVTKCKRISILLVLALVLSVLPTGAAAFSSDAEEAWQEPGNSSLNIINGGTMLTTDDVFYYSEGGIYRETTSGTTRISSDDGANLNIVGDLLYYTVDGGEVRCIPQGGGESKTVYTFVDDIKQLYVIGDRLRFISSGKCYEYDMTEDTLMRRGTLEGIVSLIPTELGDVCLVGEIFDYTLYAGGTAVLTDVTGAYYDSGYIAVYKDGQNYQVELSALFGNFVPSRDLQAFDIHGGENVISLLSLDEDDSCEVCDENSLVSAFLLDEDDEEEEEIPDDGNTIPTVSQGQLNMVKRARQLHEIAWTPLVDRYQWGYRGTFAAGVTVTGLAYGQPVNCGGYVGYNITLDAYAAAVADNTSKFNTEYSTYNKIAPYYSTDCSGFVSYAWGLKTRHTTYSWSAIATRVSDQSIYSLQVGDALNHSTSHIVMVSNVEYNDAGEMIRVTIMEQTPVKTKLTTYGEGCTYPLSKIQSYYLSGGYVIYRYPDRDSVTYTHSCAVPIDGDYCSNCKATVPRVSVSSAVGSKSVSLSHDDSSAVIYYTTDGSTPTASSNKYTGAISVTKTTTIKAMAVTSSFSSGNVLTYKVTVAQAETPKASVSSGSVSGEYVQSGSKITLTSASSGAEIFYTTDGSTPTSASTKYTEPITITANTTIKAIARANGCTDSAVATFTYKLGTVYTVTASAGSGGSISPSGSTSVVQTGSLTYKITASGGFAVSDVLVDGKSVGRVSSYTFSNVSANHTISATFASSATLPFTDVASTSWYYSAVSYAYTKNLFNGTTTTTFSPGDTMTRGMFITVLGRMAGVEEFTTNIGVVTGSDVRVRAEANTNCDVVAVMSKYSAVQILGSTSDGTYTWYNIKTGGKTGYIRGDLISVYNGALSDLKSGMYYTGYYQWAYQTGILANVVSTEADATAAITREEMAIILYNYAQKYGKTLGTTADAINFTDASSMSEAGKTAITALQRAGIINGMGDGTYQPKGTATRAQVANIFMAFAG
jgi:hypothetical protein